MFIKLLHKFSPWLHRLYCFIKGISPNGLSYNLYKTNIGSSHDIDIFIFTSNFKYRTFEDLFYIFEFIFNLLEEHYFKYNYTYTVTYYESNKYGLLRQISHPYDFKLFSQGTITTLFENIKWINPSNNPNILTYIREKIVYCHY